MRLAIFSDIHAHTEAIGTRRGDLGSYLFRRALARTLRWQKPDVILLLGDINNLGNEGQTPFLEDIHRILESSGVPYIAVAGNHDLPPDAFYRLFPDVRPYRDVAGVRFATFFDQAEPNWCCTRTPEGLAGMRALRHDGFDGPIVLLQHIPLLPAQGDFCPYRCLNRDDVIAVMRDMRINLALAGHYHPGVAPITEGEQTFYVAPALCEQPFAWADAEWDGHTFTVRPQTLRMPEELELWDLHTHTAFAYCNDDMDIPRMPEIARLMGLKGFAYTEHSCHLFFDRHELGTLRYFREGIASADAAKNRASAYFGAIAPHLSANVMAGLEVGIDANFAPMADTGSLAKARFRIAATHRLPCESAASVDPEVCADELLAAVEGSCRTGAYHALAHPFRLFRRAKLAPPARAFEPLARILKQTGVAAELNFHHNDEPREFIRLCLEMGVPLTFGTDAHDMIEVGELYPHLEMFRSFGITDPRPHLLRPETLA